MLRVGDRLRGVMDRRFRNLTLTHLECDEIWTFVRKKQGRLTEEEAVNPAVGDQYLFIAIDEETKFIPTFTLGKRTRETTELFADDLAGGSWSRRCSIRRRVRECPRTAGPPTRMPSTALSAAAWTTGQSLKTSKSRNSRAATGRR